MIAALFAAGLWGSTDALAGMSAKRSTPLLAALWLHLASIAVILPPVLFGDWPTIPLRDALCGVAAGVAAAIGDVAFGRALSKSAMTVGIPLANAIAASIPAAVLVAQGEEVIPVSTIGIAGSLLASALAVAPANGRVAVVGAEYAVFAGICFGTMFGLLAQVHVAGGLQVILLMRCAGTLALMPAVIRSTSQWKLSVLKRGLATGLLSGIASVVANWLFMLAMSGGSRVAGAVVAIGLSAPAGMLLANFAGRERLTVTQTAAAACAVIAIVFLAIPKAVL